MSKNLAVFSGIAIVISFILGCTLSKYLSVQLCIPVEISSFPLSTTFALLTIESILCLLGLLVSLLFQSDIQNSSDTEGYYFKRCIQKWYLILTGTAIGLTLLTALAILLLWAYREVGK